MIRSVSNGDGDVMAEAIGVLSESYLGGAEALRSLHVHFYESQLRAVVWVELREPTLDAQLEAVTAFAEVRECYADEFELELRFGAPQALEAELVAARAVIAHR
ncbi:hypothetical protein ACPW96_20235 [Micromonospora sp. DT81.3]|uniref:hypothetical protein n=1 Tax=Micromonospora sp. DT81.3 TaxID=3416523 RepID=UPI003CF9095A